jgi:hypothetical protein
MRLRLRHPLARGAWSPWMIRTGHEACSAAFALAEPKESGESSVAAAAGDQHGCTVGSLQQDLGGAALAYLPLRSRRRLVTDDGAHGVVEDFFIS